MSKSLDTVSSRLKTFIIWVKSYVLSGYIYIRGIKLFSNNAYLPFYCLRSITLHITAGPTVDEQMRKNVPIKRSEARHGTFGHWLMFNWIPPFFLL